MEMEILEPQIAITIGGHARRLRLRHRDLATAEMRLAQEGHPISLVGPGSAPFWFASQGGHQAGVLLLAGLLHEQPDLTLDAVRDLITFENAEYVDERLAAAVEAYLRPFLESQAKKVASALAQASQAKRQDLNSSGPISPPSPGSNWESGSRSSGDNLPGSSEPSSGDGSAAEIKKS